MESFRCAYIASILLIFIASQINFSRAQQTTDPTNVPKCESYKRKEYEKVYTRIDNCKPSTQPIVGGTAAKPKEFPHMARLGFAQKDQETKWFCGGTLISNKFVLTAAHCFYVLSCKLNIVRLGELVFNTETDNARPEDFEVARFTPHPNYRMREAYNDIGLVELKHSVNFSEYIAPSYLPIKDGNDVSQFIAIGWGAIEFTKVDSELLAEVTLDRIDNQECKDYIDGSNSQLLPNGLHESEHICAGSEALKDTCQGDSGGPLLVIHDKYPCMHYVYGITSFGFGCGFVDTPGIYTRVFNYVDWIERHVLEY